MDTFIFTVYFVFLAIWVLYTLSIIHLIIHVEIEKRRKKKNKGRELRYPPLDVKDPDIPIVTVQIPLYNEQYVAERVIDCVAAFNYPASKLEIQILDDSTDETKDIVANRVGYWQNQGIDIKHIHRTNREGYKAGALAEATPHARGEFIAMFDADFLPDKDFLINVLPYFDKDNVGVVQARWGHLNANYSLLTKLQSLSIDAFFLLEQFGRSLAGYYIRFNGSGGLWRKKCIEDAGGWTGDTLSEDLDLAFRAQMKGWKFNYTNHIECAGEVPVTIDGVKNQYYRWSKGKTEVVKKLTKPLLKLKMPFAAKFHLFADLWNIWANVAILIIAIFSVPFVHVAATSEKFANVWQWSSIGLIYTVTLIYMMAYVYYFRYQSVRRSVIDIIKDFPSFAFLFTGLTLHQNVAIFDGYRGKTTPFVRTPKYNIGEKGGAWTGSTYMPMRLSLITYVEVLLSIFFTYGVYLDFKYGLYGFVPWHLFLAIGAAYTFWLTVSQDRMKAAKKVSSKTKPELVRA